MNGYTSLQYTELPERVKAEMKCRAERTGQSIDDEEIARFADFEPRSNEDGDVEVLDGVEFTHHFVQAPGDSELLT